MNVKRKTPKENRPVGRPAMLPTNKQKARNIKMTDAEWESVREMAEQDGISIAEFIRRKVFGG